MPSWNVEEWRRPGPTPAQRRADLWTGLGVTVLTVVNLLLAHSVDLMRLEGHNAPLPEQLVWVVALALPLIWRRSHPEVVAVVTAACLIGSQVRGVQEQQVASTVVLAALYTLGAWGRDRRRVAVLRTGIVAAMVVWFVTSWSMWGYLVPTDEMTVSVINTAIVNVALFGFAWLLGSTVWQAVRREQQLEHQAAELRVARDLAAERAVFGERVRIARELHDVVAHHVSVMGIQASAARRALEKDPVRARTALASIEESARTAVAELRRMLGALRASGATAEAPVAGIDRLSEIADRAREAGLQVHLAVYGEPVPLPDSLSQAAYRIAQEAVTNTLKHAHASTLDLRVRYLAGEIEMDIADDGRGTVPRSPDGMGLIGMRERVAVHDGTLEHGPRRTGGYRVRARLPLVGDRV